MDEDTSLNWQTREVLVVDQPDVNRSSHLLILTGALMPLVPGLALTNALRDLFKGDLLSGMVKICEALLTAFALGGGVGIILKFLGA